MSAFSSAEKSTSLIAFCHTHTATRFKLFRVMFPNLDNKMSNVLSNFRRLFYRWRMQTSKRRESVDFYVRYLCRWVIYNIYNDISVFNLIITFECGALKIQFYIQRFTVSIRNSTTKVVFFPVKSILSADNGCVINYDSD